MFSEFEFFILIDPDEQRADGTIKNLGMMPESYVHATRAVLKTIAETKTGYCVLHTIRLWRKFVRISPFEDSAFSNDACGIGGGGSTDFGEAKDLVYNKSLHNLPPWKALPFYYNYPVGAVIRFTPTRYLEGGGCYEKHKNPAVSDFAPTPDEVLLHELTHAVRTTSRTLDVASPTHQDSKRFGLYDSEEEFIAVLVENMYLSELRRSLRASHTAFRNLEGELNDSFQFFKVSRKAFTVIDKFCTQNKYFAPRLAQLKVPFNPVAAYYQNRKKCQDLSNSLDAGIRDNGREYFKVLTPAYPWTEWNKLINSAGQ